MNLSKVDTSCSGERLPSGDTEGSSRLPSLNGWRTVSITMVVGAHCTFTPGFPHDLEGLFKWMFDGELGVRCFFLISGLLITWLMLIENRVSGQVHLGRFYIRRCLRILPVYVAFLLVLAGLQAFTPFAQETAQWIANLTFTTNFILGSWTSAHLWSLAVEEQFYLLWPFSFVMFGLATRFRRTFLILGTILILSSLSRLVTYTQMSTSPLFCRSSLLNCMDSLAIGCGCAFLLDRYPSILKRVLTTRPWKPALVALAMILTPYILVRLLILGIVTVPLGSTLEVLGLAVLVLQSIFMPDWGFYRILNWRLVSNIGILSYSIYIWQQIFCTKPELFGLGPVWWISFPGWLVAVLVVSFVSYHGLERPLFNLRTRFRHAGHRHNCPVVGAA
ncbi:MAG: acyltransferase [Magnetococcales bacterium]|nr:acyltransferase [Magnetococcales bacterium]